jgi:hypothetical protein
MPQSSAKGAASVWITWVAINMPNKKSPVFSINSEKGDLFLRGVVAKKC